MSGGNWILEIQLIGGGNDHIATLEFATLRSLQIALTENGGKKFFVTMLGDVTSDDRNALPDLRGRGFDIAVRV